MSGAEIHRRVSEAMAWRERRAGRPVRTARTGAFAAVAGELGWLPGQVAAAYYAAQQARAAVAGRDALEHRPEEARARIAAQAVVLPGEPLIDVLSPEREAAATELERLYAARQAAEAAQGDDDGAALAAVNAAEEARARRECPHGVDQLRDRAICNECEAALEEAAMARGPLL